MLLQWFRSKAEFHYTESNIQHQNKIRKCGIPLYPNCRNKQTSKTHSFSHTLMFTLICQQTSSPWLRFLTSLSEPEWFGCTDLCFNQPACRCALKESVSSAPPSSPLWWRWPAAPSASPYEAGWRYSRWSCWTYWCSWLQPHSLPASRVARPQQRQISARGRHHDVLHICYTWSSSSSWVLNNCSSTAEGWEAGEGSYICRCTSGNTICHRGGTRLITWSLDKCSHLFPGHDGGLDRSDGRDRQSGGGRNRSADKNDEDYNTVTQYTSVTSGSLCIWKPTLFHTEAGNPKTSCLYDGRYRSLSCNIDWWQWSYLTGVGVGPFTCLTGEGDCCRPPATLETKDGGDLEVGFGGTRGGVLCAKCWVIIPPSTCISIMVVAWKLASTFCRGRTCNEWCILWRQL